MNGIPPERELPELTDHQINLLDSICKAASGSTQGPFKTLFHQYDKLSQEQGLDTSRDNAVYRWMLRVGEKARRDQKFGRPVRFIPYLRSLLEAQGITVVDEDGNKEDDLVVQSSDSPDAAPDGQASKPNRRVSFDDARMEETWLSERPQSPQPLPAVPRNDLLRQPPRRPGGVHFNQRARSVSSERDFGLYQPVSKHFQDASLSSGDMSEYEEPRNPTLFFSLSHTQREQNAAVFCKVSEDRLFRRCFHIWHDRALSLRAQHEQAFSEASGLDRNRLLKESFDYWRLALQKRTQERVRFATLDGNLAVLLEKRNYRLLDKSFSHWCGSAVYQIRANEHTQRQLLRKRYFTKWRNLAVENAAKVRSVLCGKYLALWREKTIRRAIVHQQADAHYEEALTHKCLRRLLWVWREGLVAGRHDVWIQRNAFDTLLRKVDHYATLAEQAEVWRTQRLTKATLQALAEQHRKQQHASAAAQSRYDQTLAKSWICSLRVQTKLAPLAATLSARIAINLKTKVFRVWHLHLTLNRQATDVNRKRVLQSAWTSWNDSLRCKALTQRIDERIVKENLRKWVLRSRAETFKRMHNGKLLHHMLAQWRANLQNHDKTLEEAITKFAESQRWRRLKYGMLRLHAALRNREAIERSAIEFSNSRALPDVLEVWKQRDQHLRQLDTWAADARFYCLCSRTLKVWQERTTEHKHQKRRAAYAQVRAKVKTRIVRNCFDRLSIKTAEVSAIKQEAARKAQLRLFATGTAAFDTWRNNAARCTELDVQAADVDNRKLLSSALSALVNHHVDLGAMEQQAILFRQQAEMALLASTLRKFQWAVFTAARRRESADALWVRNRDQHMKYLLRHWASQTASRRTARHAPGQQDPESPSLGPASRAISRSMERPALGSSPPRTKTPAYMRTPSRARRAGRFRPLPTPAHLTPMIFDRGYYVTTPAPLTSARRDNAVESSDVFDALTPQITPFARKLRAGGVAQAPPSALRSSILGRSVAGTSKSVRFAGSSRFGSGPRKSNATDE